jgi:hypothetical protein
MSDRLSMARIGAVADTKASAAFDVAQRLCAVETAIAEAQMRAAELAAAMPRAWQDADLSFVVGMGAFDRVGAIVSTMTQARREAGEAHRILDAVRSKVNLPEVGWGDKVVMNDASDNVVALNV